MSKRNPVFIVGCPRSGTSWLYAMLESVDDFAVYRAETRAFDVLGPRFGGLRSPRDLARALEVWEKSDQFRIAGLDVEPFRRKILQNCRNTGDFLRIFMESVARQQQVTRWAENTPGHLLHIREIKRTIPDALFVHIIRDGRDVALSLEKQGWVRTLPWDRPHSLLAAGLYWRWTVSRGMRAGRQVGPDYMEVRYEDLLAHPQQTLDAIGAFIGHEIRYDEILRAGVGEVRRPNTSFPNDRNYIGRWQKSLAPQQLAHLELLTGPLLDELGYPRATGAPLPLRAPVMRPAYEILFEFRHQLKLRPAISRRMVNADTLYPGAVYPELSGTPSAGRSIAAEASGRQ